MTSAGPPIPAVAVTFDALAAHGQIPLATDTRSTRWRSPTIRGLEDEVRPLDEVIGSK
jgi:hypothetical protein